MESTMSTINKELYDALIEAKVGEETATKAARSVQGEEQNKRLGNIDKRLIVVETKLDTINRLLWIVIAGVAGILIKTLLV